MTGVTGLVGAGFATNLLRENQNYTIVSLCRSFGNKSGLERTKEIIKEQCEFDGKNDAEMIEYAGLGVAMENASDDVKKYADVIAKRNNDDGVLEIIKKYIGE